MLMLSRDYMSGFVHGAFGVALVVLIGLLPIFIQRLRQ